MTELRDMRWKYLRENNKKYFDPDRNTALADYLSYIFKDHTFVYDALIPKDVIVDRNPDASYRRFRPDARCEELNLIVEFDGVAHYQDPQVVLNDQDKDRYLSSLGYKVVRIPYWIQLSQEVIQYLFEVDIDDEMCTIYCSFHDIDKDTFNISISVGAMCQLGRDRFLNEIIHMPIHTQIDVYYDILWCCIKGIEMHIKPDSIMPADVMYRWRFDEILYDMSDCSVDIDTLTKAEMILYNQPYASTSYCHGEMRFFKIDDCQYTRLNESCNLSNNLSEISDNKKLIEDMYRILRHLHTHQELLPNIQLTGISFSPYNPRFGIYICGFICDIPKNTEYATLIDEIDNLIETYAAELDINLFVSKSEKSDSLIYDVAVV